MQTRSREDTRAHSVPLKKRCAHTHNGGALLHSALELYMSVFSASKRLTAEQSDHVANVLFSLIFFYKRQNYKSSLQINI